MGGHIFSVHAAHPREGWADSGADLLLEAGVDGSIVFTVGIGDDPTSYESDDYRPWSSKGIVPIARVNHAYHPDGTIPPADRRPGGAVRFANYVQGAQGCEIFIVGNEPNHGQERPDGAPITAEDYGLYYAACRAVAHSRRPGVAILIAGPATWNNETGDYIEYLAEAVRVAGELGTVDGVAIHAYTHGADPALVFSDDKWAPPFEDYYAHFRTYRDQLAVLADASTPAGLRIYLTESDQEDPWVDQNSGWVQNVYREIHEWNQVNPAQQIRSVGLFRYPDRDRWYFGNLDGVLSDFREAMTHKEYTWRDDDMPWDLVKEDGFEDDTNDVDQEGDGEVIVPAPWLAKWTQAGGQVRPSVKPKDKRPPWNHPEVFSGNRAVSIGSAYAAHDSWLVDRAYGVKAGELIRVYAMAMGVSHHKDGAVGGGLGQLVGVGPGTSLDGVVWGEWWSSDLDDWAERKWAAVSVQTVAPIDDPYIYLRSVAREAYEAQYSHFDQVEVHVQRNGGGIPPVDPPTGTYTVVVYDPAGKEIARCPFEAGTVNPQICAHAQEIVKLACPGG